MAGTGRRNRHKMGSHLIQDDISGYTEYIESVVTDWRGFIVHKDYVEHRNPQEFIRVGTDPKALADIRPQTIQDAYVSAITSTVGLTNVPRAKGPFTHFYTTVSAGSP